MKYYLYRHIRLDKNEVFYIGIGSKKKATYVTYRDEYDRAFTRRSRNKHWKHIIDKTDYDVEILFETDDINLIQSKEKEFIKLYGRKDLNTGTLANYTDGGLGGNRIGHSNTQNQKDIVSKMFKGKPKSAEHKEKLRLAKLGRKRKPITDETKKRMSEAAKKRESLKNSTMLLSQTLQHFSM
jgi:hypothetical protein